jgi:membrane associated rhomboid family serine protease
VIPLHDNNTSRTRPVFNWLLILANCYMFYIELRFQQSAALESFLFHWSVVPSRLWNMIIPDGLTLVTAMFLHGGWTHLFGNMLFLYVFGPSVEDRMGHLRYLFFYFTVGVFANAVQAYIAPTSNIPLLGASGAIAGVLGAYFFYYPYARIATLIPLGFFTRIIDIPAFIFLGLWFAMQAVQGTMSLSPGMKTLQKVGGVAWWAHASGFVFGLITGPALAKRLSRGRKSEFRA